MHKLKQLGSSLSGLVERIETYDGLGRYVASATAIIFKQLIKDPENYRLANTLHMDGILDKECELEDKYKPLIIKILDECGKEYMQDQDLRTMINAALPSGKYLLTKYPAKNKKGIMQEKKINWNPEGRSYNNKYYDESEIFGR